MNSDCASLLFRYGEEKNSTGGVQAGVGKKSSFLSGNSLTRHGCDWPLIEDDDENSVYPAKSRTVASCTPGRSERRVAARYGRVARATHSENAS
jgi:hypothetical protein